MRNLKNNVAQWIPIAIVLFGSLFAAGQIANTQANLVREIKTKLNAELYDKDQGHRQREFDRLQIQLDRIEEKIDAISGTYKSGLTTDGNPQP